MYKRQGLATTDNREELDKLLNKLVEAFQIVDIKHEDDFEYLKMKFLTRRMVYMQMQNHTPDYTLLLAEDLYYGNRTSRKALRSLRVKRRYLHYQTWCQW